jgi:hypothetical protein
VEGFCKAASGARWNNYRLSRRIAPSSSHLLPDRPLKARLLMMLVFRVSASCPRVGLLFKQQYERIPINVSQGKPDSGFECEATENSPISLYSTCAGQQ